MRCYSILFYFPNQKNEEPPPTSRAMRVSALAPVVYKRPFIFGWVILANCKQIIRKSTPSPSPSTFPFPVLRTSLCHLSADELCHLPVCAQCWTARLLIERSRAIKCPTVCGQLANTKRVQQALYERADWVKRLVAQLADGCATQAAHFDTDTDTDTAEAVNTKGSWKDVDALRDDIYGTFMPQHSILPVCSSLRHTYSPPSPSPSRFNVSFAKPLAIF